MSTDPEPVDTALGSPTPAVSASVSASDPASLADPLDLCIERLDAAEADLRARLAALDGR